MNIYFSGIGGVGIGPLTEIAHDAGFNVQGSDAREGLLTRELQQRGIPVSIGQDGSFLQTCHDKQPIDWFVYTAALPPDHPELLLAKQLGIKTTKRDGLLAAIIKAKDLKLIAIAGTHGKTTTTGMLVWTLQQLGIPVSYSIGSTLSFGPSGKFDPASQYFIYECDEFDRNFLHFKPYLSLITSIGYDHPDAYPTEQLYLDAFSEFINQSETTIMWKADADKVDASSRNGWILGAEQELDVKLAGAHNRRNATLVQKAVECLQVMQPDNPAQHVDAQETTEILSRFPGTDRRFEKLADNLYTDYGHHPVEIAATLQLARELSKHVILIYQPHQNVRQHEIKDQYTNQFELAEKIYWLPTYLSREDPQLPILTPSELTARITNPGALQIADLDDTLRSVVKKARQEGKLVLGMGAGSIDSWLRDNHTL